MKNILFLKHYFRWNYDKQFFFKYFNVCYKNLLPQHYIWFHKYFRIFTVEIFFRILLSLVCQAMNMDRDITVISHPYLHKTPSLIFHSCSTVNLRWVDGSQRS